MHSFLSIYKKVPLARLCKHIVANNRYVDSVLTMTTLQGTFPLLKSDATCNVTLGSRGITYETSNGSLKEHFDIRDITGCTCNKIENDGTAVSLNIISYPLIKDNRVRKVVSFRVNEDESYNENMLKATKWKEALYTTMYVIPPNHEKGTLITSSPLFSSKKKLMVFINPKSGTGIAKKIYKKHVKPLLEEGEVHHEVFLTGWAKGAYAAVQKIKPNQLSAIVVISGDGLLYEIYNGLLQREDWETALSFPVAILPGGSGNGLARSVGHVLDEPYLRNPVLVSTLNILNPVVTPMDLVLVHTPKERLISFLSIGIGLLSDIDIESECLRAIGEVRFTIWGLWRLLKLRRYKCKLSFKRAHKEVTDVRRKQSTLSRSSSLKNCQEPTIRNCWLSTNDVFETVDVHNPRKRSTMESVGTVLDSPVPDDWEVLEDNFAFIHAVVQPFIGKDGYISPESKLNDGIIYMWVASSKATKQSLFTFLVDLETGSTPEEGISCIPVSAFRIEPYAKKGYMNVDGELIDLAPIQAEILPGKGSILVRPK